MENTPTIPAFSTGKGQLLGKGKAVSLPGYIQAQTNNVLLEATNLYKQTNLEEEEGRQFMKVNLAVAPHPYLTPTRCPSPPLLRKAFIPDSNSSEKCHKHKWFHKAC